MTPECPCFTDPDNSPCGEQAGNVSLCICADNGYVVKYGWPVPA